MDMSVVRFRGYVGLMDVSVTRDYNYTSICGQTRCSFLLENITCGSCGPFVWDCFEAYF